jgi:hypothetical protein
MSPTAEREAEVAPTGQPVGASRLRRLQGIVPPPTGPDVFMPPSDARGPIAPSYDSILEQVV